MDWGSFLEPFLGGAVGGGLAAAGYHALSARHIFATEREQVRALLARARIDLEEAASELEKWSARGARERARVEQAERRTSNGGTPTLEAPTRFASTRAYSKHLERGGARDLDFERAAGWGA